MTPSEREALANVMLRVGVTADLMGRFDARGAAGPAEAFPEVFTAGTVGKRFVDYSEAVHLAEVLADKRGLATKLRKALKEIDPRYLEGLTSVRAVPQEVLQRLAETTTKTVYGLYDPPTKTVYVSDRLRGVDVPHVVTHEVGHHAWTRLPEEQKLRWMAHTQGQVAQVSAYAASSPLEHFAEGFRAAHLSPGHLAKTEAGTMAFMQREVGVVPKGTAASVTAPSEAVKVVEAQVNALRQQAAEAGAKVAALQDKLEESDARIAELKRQLKALKERGRHLMATQKRLRGQARVLNAKELLKLRPERAVSIFNRMRPNPLGQAYLDGQRYRAFTMARVTDQHVLQRVHRMLGQRLKSGELKTESFKKTVNKRLDELGLTPKNPQYAEMVLRTNINSVYNAGYHEEVATDPDLSDYFPVWEYVAVEDHRLGEDHAAHLTGGINGTAYYPASRSFEEVRGDRPFNCRCGARWVDKFEARKAGVA